MEGIESTREAAPISGIVHGVEAEWMPSGQKGAEVAFIIFSLVQRDSMGVHQNRMAIHAHVSRLTKDEIEEVGKKLLKLQEELGVNEHSRSFWSQLGSGINVSLAIIEISAGAALVVPNPVLGIGLIVDGIAKGAGEALWLTGGHEKLASKVMPEATKDEQRLLATQIHGVVSGVGLVTSIALGFMGGTVLAEAGKWISRGAVGMEIFQTAGGGVALWKQGEAIGKGEKLKAAWGDAESDHAILRANFDQETSFFKTAGDDLSLAAKAAADDSGMKISRAAAMAAMS